jgi:hypothetical protein
MGNQASTSYLAYLAYLATLFPHESVGRGAYLSFLSQSAFFFREMRGRRGFLQACVLRFAGPG